MKKEEITSFRCLVYWGKGNIKVLVDTSYIYPKPPNCKIYTILEVFSFVISLSDKIEVR